MSNLSIVRRLKNSYAPRRVLVLFTDGANTAENRLTPEQSADLAKEFNCIVHTVGIGSDNAYVLAQGYGFQKVQGSFDEKLLSSIASVTGGTYFRAADKAGMKKVMEEINALEKTNIEQPKFVEYKEYAPTLALAGALLLLCAFAWENLIRVRIP